MAALLDYQVEVFLQRFVVLQRVQVNFIGRRARLVTSLVLALVLARRKHCCCGQQQEVEANAWHCLGSSLNGYGYDDVKDDMMAIGIGQVFPFPVRSSWSAMA